MNGPCASQTKNAPEFTKARSAGRQDGQAKNEVRDVTAEACIAYAIAHSFERQSVTREVNFLADALKFGVGAVSVEEVRAEFHQRMRDGKIIAGKIDGRAHVTTPEVLQEEREMVSWARNGRGTRKSLGADPEAKRAAFAELTSGGLTPDARQIAAVEHVLTSQDRVILVRGKAGTGKTSMMRAAHVGILAGGKDVFFFAPGAEASRGVLASEGFEDATTVAKLLQDEELQSQVRNSVIWVDEAGTLGAQDMRRLFGIAEQAKARVILSGDVTQHAAVARGDALKILESEAGLNPAELTRIYRQTNRDYREAVEAISRGDAKGVLAGFKALEEMGAIREVKSEERYAHLAEAYLQAVIEDNKTTLVVSPTHSEGAKVTETIRDGLRQAGRLEGEEREVLRLRSVGLTEAERSDAANYREGQVIQAHGRVKSLKARRQVRGRGEGRPRHDLATGEPDQRARRLAAGEEPGVRCV